MCRNSSKSYMLDTQVGADGWLAVAVGNSVQQTQWL